MQSLLAKKRFAEELVANELAPKTNQLKEKLAEYKKTLGYQNELSFLKKLVEQKASDMVNIESSDESENKFKVKDHFDYSFVSEFGKYIKQFLEKCKYPNLTSLIFDKATIENEIPEIDYSNVNLIHFTKNANTGRYGFLIDVMD